MARSLFEVKLDVSQIERLQERLGEIRAEDLSVSLVDTLNRVAKETYDLSRRKMLSGINLDDAYVQRRMRVKEATGSSPKAEIVADGSRTTSLSHYGAMQLTADVNWTNERIRGMGKKFSKWPGWTERTGSPGRGIAVNKKAAGQSVEVVRGRRKKMGPIFTIPGKRDNDGKLVLFRRNDNDKIESLQGPSVYQLFRFTANQIVGEVTDNLEAAIVAAAEREFEKALK